MKPDLTNKKPNLRLRVVQYNGRFYLVDHNRNHWYNGGIRLWNSMNDALFTGYETEAEAWTHAPSAEDYNILAPEFTLVHIVIKLDTGDAIEAVIDKQNHIMCLLQLPKVGEPFMIFHDLRGTEHLVCAKRIVNVTFNEVD